MLKKIVGWLVLAFLLFYVVSDPSGAGQAVRQAIDSAGQFVSALTGGGGQ